MTRRVTLHFVSGALEPSRIVESASGDLRLNLDHRSGLPGVRVSGDRPAGVRQSCRAARLCARAGGVVVPRRDRAPERHRRAARLRPLLSLGEADRRRPGLARGPSVQGSPAARRRDRPGARHPCPRLGADHLRRAVRRRRPRNQHRDGLVAQGVVTRTRLRARPRRPLPDRSGAHGHAHPRARVPACARRAARAARPRPRPRPRPRSCRRHGPGSASTSASTRLASSESSRGRPWGAPRSWACVRARRPLPSRCAATRRRPPRARRAPGGFAPGRFRPRSSRALGTATRPSVPSASWACCAARAPASRIPGRIPVCSSRPGRASAFDWPLSERLSLRTHLDATLDLRRAHLEVGGVDAWTAPLVAGAAGAGLAANFE